MLAAIRLLTVLVLAGFIVFVVRDFARRHPEDMPGTPLDLTAPIGWATAEKLAGLRNHPAECRALLTAAGVAFAPIALRDDGPGCSLRDTVRVTDPGVPLRPGGLVMSCPLAAALTVYVRHIVVPALRAAGEHATTITDLGTYNCRRIAGTDRLSEHATANAIDIAGAHVTHGEVSIAHDWRDRGRRGELVRRLRDGACRVFGVVLSPAYNVAHHDHLHLDMGRGRVCG